VGPYWACVDSEKRDSNESAVSSQAEYGVAQLESIFVLLFVVLVKVDI